MTEELRKGDGSKGTVAHLLFENFRDAGFVADSDAPPSSVQADLHGVVETITVAPSQMVIGQERVMLPVGVRDRNKLMRRVTEDWLI